MLKKLGLSLIKLDLPFRLNHVNCFIGEGPNGVTVIDAGLHNKQTVKRWEMELAEKVVTDIFITHYHPDHFGYAGGLQEKTGAHVSMSEIDANLGSIVWKENFMSNSIQHYALAGVPTVMGKKMVANTEEFVAAVTPYPTINHYFQEGEQVVIGNYEYEVIFTPGHSDGLVNFYNKEKSVLLSTDHILPKITPNISYWFHGDPNPLDTYIKSLQKVRKLAADFVIPSHGKPFYGANKRIDEIIAHHEERLEETLAMIKGRITVHEVCKQLFSRELTVHELRFAIGETIAHLEYLRTIGECQRETIRGKWHYFI